MTQRSYAFLIFCLALVILSFALLPLMSVEAQGIVPCGSPGQPSCTLCHLAQLAQNSLNFAVYISVFVATLMIAFAGFLYITAGGDTSKISKATGIFGKVLIGIIVVLTAWLIVDTIMKSLLSTQYTKFGPWNELCPFIPGGGASPATEPPPGTVDVGFVPTYGSDTLSHDEALNRLFTAGVQVTSTTGQTGVQAACSGAGCTSLEGARTDTVTQLIYIKEACGASCPVVVTGFTEGGVHSEGQFSHANGYKVDVDDSSVLDQWFYQNLIPDGERSGNNGGPRYRDDCGNEYVRETRSSHWDIKVTRVCSFTE